MLVMGVTYKENVEDTRETPVRDMIKELQDYGVEVFGFDPVAKEPEKAYGIRFIDNLEKSPKMDCVILTVAHDAFRRITPAMIRQSMNSSPVLIDIRGLYDTPETYSLGFVYKRL